MALLSSREIKHLLFSVIILTVVFAFNDKRPAFELGYWIANLVKVFFIVFFSIVLHNFAHKLMAQKYGFITEHRTWGIRNLGWKKEPSYPKVVHIFGKEFEIDSFPIGAVLGVIVMLFSNGTLYFAAIERYDLLIERIGRFGKKYVNVTDFEEAKIAIMGPMVNVFLAIIFSLFDTKGLLGQAALINTMIAIFHMLPLPGLDGLKVLMGSIPLYIFSIGFIAGVALLIQFISPAFALIVAAALAVVFAFLFFYFRVFK